MSRLKLVISGDISLYLVILISTLLFSSESQYHVKTRIIDVDFTRGPEIYERIAKEIEGLEIGVLINNVGMSYTYPEYLAQVNSSKLKFLFG